MDKSDVSEICPLSRKAVARLLAERAARSGASSVNGRRIAPRWPFPGTVELWIPDENGVEQHTLATSLNLSEHGIGINMDDRLPVDLELAIAIHEPEVSFHGRAVVRHCTDIECGYYIGMQFKFDSA
jgi:hypothetical protein